MTISVGQKECKFQIVEKSIKYLGVFFAAFAVQHKLISCSLTLRDQKFKVSNVK